MKKIIITGANSYIGTSFEKWCSQFPNQYLIKIIDMTEESWKEESFQGFNAVFHVAGLVHIKERKGNADLYYKINHDLTLEAAKKAKQEGIKHFIFLSTMSVYGINKGYITWDTPANPTTNYGKSKLLGENSIKEYSDENFIVSILRLPMVFGYNCKGNYQRLSEFLYRLPIFPEVMNERSMIYIDNLSEYVRLLIDEPMEGTFYPQNQEYVCTTELVKLIARERNMKIKTTKLFNPLIKVLKISYIEKMFGSLVYEKQMSDNFSYNYCITNLEDAIKAIEYERSRAFSNDIVTNLE